MKIKSFTLENFRTFKDTTTFEISDINVFIGSNSAGKSNIIEFLKFLRGLANQTFSKSFNEYTFDRNNNPISFEIELELDDSEIDSIVNRITPTESIHNYKKDNLFKTIKYTSKVNPQRCLDESFQIWAIDQYVTLIRYLFTPPRQLERNFVNLDRHYRDNRGETRGLLSQSPSDRNTANDTPLGILVPYLNPESTDFFIVQMMTKFFQNIRIFDAFRRVDPEFQGAEKRILFETGGNLNEVMSTLLGNNRTRFENIMKNYDKILGSNLTVNVPLAESNTFHTVTITEEGIESQTDFRNMSTGLHQALILVLAIEQSQKNEIICIEEPEINLHSSAQKRLFKLIFDHCKTNQFFITSHSPIFTRIGDGFSTYLVIRNKGISSAIRIEEEDQLRFVRQQLGIRNSDFFGNDYVIFVEGYSEEIALPKIAKALGFDDVGVEPNKRVRVINLKGSGMIPKLRNFLDYLKNSDTGIFLMADANSDVGSTVDDFIRECRILKDHQIVWPQEFEDTFESDFIICAMKNICDAKKVSFSLTVTDLDNFRKNKTIGKILEGYMPQQELGNFSKIELATELANMVSSEIASNETRKKTTFEVKIQEFLDIIKQEDEKIK